MNNSEKIVADQSRVNLWWISFVLFNIGNSKQHNFLHVFFHSSLTDNEISEILKKSLLDKAK